MAGSPGAVCAASLKTTTKTLWNAIRIIREVVEV